MSKVNGIAMQEYGLRFRFWPRLCDNSVSGSFRPIRLIQRAHEGT